MNTHSQLRAVLRALRKNRGLNQTQTGALLGVSQKRIARIESNPGVTSFDQIARLVSALGGSLLVEENDVTGIVAESAPDMPRKARSKTRPGDHDTW